MTEFAMTPIGLIAEGPNVRSKLGDLSELAASISEHGLLQPVTVRRKGAGLELVFGFRRFRAAKLAQLSDLPTLTRDLTDEEVTEIQTIENDHREGLDPLDQALGYQRLMATPGRTVSQVAARVGRPPAYVAQLLRLCSASEKCTDAISEERISLGVALLIAKLPTPELQDKALELVAVDYEGDGPMPVAFAKKRIELEVMRDLTAAPFDRASTELVPPAGSCSACPKRTGAQAELFGDGTSPDLCTDPVCYRGKLDAHWANAQAEAKAKGLEVLTKVKAEQATRHHSGGESGFQRLDDHVYIGSKKRTVRQLLGGKDAEPVAIARDEHTGVPVELVAKRDVDAAVKAARAAAGEKEPEGPSDFQKKQAEQRKAARARRAAFVEALAVGVEAKCKRGSDITDGVLRGLVFAAIELAPSEARIAVVKRRGLAPLADTPPDRLLKLKAENETMFARLLSMLVELLVAGRDAFAGDAGEGESSGLLLLDALELDVNAIIGKRDTKPERKAAKPKGKPGASPQRGGKMHLVSSMTGGPACGAKMRGTVGEGGSTSLQTVTCESCLRVGPSILESERGAGRGKAAKAKSANKKKKAPKAGPKKRVKP